MERLKQNLFSCELRLRGEIINSIPLEGVTRTELKFLAFIHGHEAIVGMKLTAKDAELVLETKEDGTKVYVMSQDDEYRRIARKYDAIVNPGIGRARVEKCFGVSLIDFDAMIEQVDPLEEMDRQAALAEAKAAIAEGASLRPKEPDAPPLPPSGEAVEDKQPAAPLGVGSALAAATSARNRN